VQYYELWGSEIPDPGLETAYFDFSTGKAYDLYFKTGRTGFTIKEIKK
jgi:hypothetical protein